MIEIGFVIRQTKGGAVLETTHRYPAAANGPERVRITKKRLRNTPHKDAVEKAVMMCHKSIAFMFDLCVDGGRKAIRWTFEYTPVE